MTQYQQHANLLRGDDTEMDGPSMEEYVAPVQQQTVAQYQRPAQPDWNQAADSYLAQGSDLPQRAAVTEPALAQYIAKKQAAVAPIAAVKEVLAPAQGVRDSEGTRNFDMDPQLMSDYQMVNGVGARDMEGTRNFDMDVSDYQKENGIGTRDANGRNFDLDPQPLVRDGQDPYVFNAKINEPYAVNYPKSAPIAPVTDTSFGRKLSYIDIMNSMNGRQSRGIDAYDSQLNNPGSGPGLVTRFGRPQAKDLQYQQLPSWYPSARFGR